MSPPNSAWTPADLKDYGEKEARWDHQAQIRELYDYTAFGPFPWFALVRWLYTRAWLASESPSVLFDLATHRLVQAKVLLPGVSVLERLVAGVRERTTARQFRLLAAVPNTLQRATLESWWASRTAAGSRGSRNIGTETSAKR